MTPRGNAPRRPQRPGRPNKDKENLESDLRQARAARKAETAQKQRLRRGEWETELEDVSGEPESLDFGAADEGEDNGEGEESAGR
jgi:hypothetical protein